MGIVSAIKPMSISAALIVRAVMSIAAHGESPSDSPTRPALPAPPPILPEITPPPPRETRTAIPPGAIGIAEMDASGAIHLHLSAPPAPALQPIVPWTGPQERLGYGEIELRRWDPHYDDLLRHIAGLAPGQTKPVLPWREDEAWHCALDPDRGPCPGLHLLPNRIGLR